MLFNSIDFAIFLPIVFILYWFVTQKSVQLQNVLIVIASYVFYGWWDWKFLSLIVFSTLVDYYVGVSLAKQDDKFKRRALLWLSILVNLGFLGFFKYYNFFLDNFITAFSFFGTSINASGLEIILPVGISFYTFQTLSYSIDVYRRKLEPTNDFIAFSVFVCFFPQLVAGPIERATHLLPQFYTKRKFEYDKAVDGMRQILWGLFKKIVIADNCAANVDQIFADIPDQSGSTLLLGGFYFAFQIYCDFSGYSDIAIGTSRLFGFDLMQNFSFPYFSRSIAEFWRRWHISLSTWFRDYLYIPLGGSKEGLSKAIRNTFIIFIISGFWHGANWTFIIWGLLHALFIIPSIVFKTNRNNTDSVAEGKLIPSIKELFQMGLTFFLVIIGWIFFRAENIQHAITYLSHMFSSSLLSKPLTKGDNGLLLCMFIFISIEWIQREKRFGLQIDGISYSAIRWSVYSSIALLIFFFGAKSGTFIYFQF